MSKLTKEELALPPTIKISITQFGRVIEEMEFSIKSTTFLGSHTREFKGDEFNLSVKNEFFYKAWENFDKAME